MEFNENLKKGKNDKVLVTKDNQKIRGKTSIKKQ